MLESKESKSSGKVKSEKYDEIIYLVFHASNEAGLDGGRADLLHKAKEKNIKIIYLSPADFKYGHLQYSPKFEPLKNVTNKSKIKIMGHGGAGLSFVTSDDADSLRRQIPFDVKCAAAILNLIDREKLKSDSKNFRPEDLLKITVMACEGGKNGPKGQPSFAERLAKELYGIQLYCRVQGATTFIHPSSRGNIYTGNPHLEGVWFVRARRIVQNLLFPFIQLEKMHISNKANKRIFIPDFSEGTVKVKEIAPEPCQKSVWSYSGIEAQLNPHGNVYMSSLTPEGMGMVDTLSKSGVFTDSIITNELKDTVAPRIPEKPKKTGFHSVETQLDPYSNFFATSMTTPESAGIADSLPKTEYN